MATEQPAFLAVEERDGRATLGGRRRFLGDIDTAAQAAEEIHGRLFAIEPVEVVDITPVSASTHVRLVDLPDLDPTPRVLATMACPCGTRTELLEGEDRAEWDAAIALHDTCVKEVA